MKQFKGGVAVITGAASGLGKEFAKTSADLGMRLVLADIQTPALNATVEEFRAQGVEAVGIRVDVSREADVQALANKAMDTFGTVNLLFNNAGVTAGGFVWENTEKDWNWVMGVNLYGISNGLRVFTPLMVEAASNDPSGYGALFCLQARCRRTK